MAFEEFTDPRLVAVYDLLDPARGDLAGYLALADASGPATVLDVGCGTGWLACELARRGHRVTGVDPAPAMLEVARRRPGGDRVRWVAGTAADVPDRDAYDLALMTGHVVQVIADDADVADAFAAVRRALRPGGRLAFESRDPAARAWEDWTPAATRRSLGPVEIWSDGTEVDGDLVAGDLHYRFADGTRLVSRGVLRFRTAARLTAMLTAAGFGAVTVDAVDGELAVVARR